MKKKYAAVAIGLILAALPLNGCGKANTNDTSTSVESTESNVIYGEVSKVEEDTITITVGTLKKNKDKQEDKENKKTSENPGKAPEGGPEGKNPDMGMDGRLDLTEEQKEIKISEDTVIQKQEMRNPLDDGKQKEKVAKSKDVQTPPEKPGDENSPQNNDMPDGRPESVPQEGKEISVHEIATSDIVAVTVKDDGTVEKITVMSDRGGMRENTVSGQGEDISGTT